MTHFNSREFSIRTCTTRGGSSYRSMSRHRTRSGFAHIPCTLTESTWKESAIRTASLFDSYICRLTTSSTGAWTTHPMCLRLTSSRSSPASRRRRSRRCCGAFRWWTSRSGRSCSSSSRGRRQRLYERPIYRFRPPAAALLDLREGRLARERGPIRARGRERIIDVDDPHDLRRERDLVAAQAVRVARAVVAFVMPADDRLQIPRKFDGREQLQAPDRVHLHHLEFGVCERAGLVQDLVRDAYLPQVVEVRAEADRGLAGLVEREDAHHGHRVLRHPLAMTEGVAVRGLDRLPPLAHHCEVGGFELGHLAADIHEIDARVEPTKEPMGGVQQRERFLIPPHRLIHQGQLVRRLRLVQHRAGVHRQ